MKLRRSQTLRIRILERKVADMTVTLTALTSAVSSLTTSVDALIADNATPSQAEVDAVTAQVTSLEATVTAALPAPAPVA